MALRLAASRRGLLTPPPPPLLLMLLLMLLLTLLMPLATVEASNKPVLIVHGLFDDPEHLQALRGYIEEAHPGTNVTVFSLFNNMESLKPLWSQVKGFGAMMGPIMQEAPDGVHIICYSQGGLVCRGVLSIMPNHNVDTFISLSSPQAGQYGDTNYLWWLFPKYVKSTLFHFCYTELGQDVSICNYWKDPHHLGDYLKSSQFLSFLNNEREHASAAEWKKNFLRINRLVLIGGPDDGVITPWQSSHFGFYDGNETVQEMKDQEVYQRDMFGLRTLDERGALTVYEVPGVTHTSWHSNRTVFDRYISKWLS